MNHEAESGRSQHRIRYRRTDSYSSVQGTASENEGKARLCKTIIVWKEVDPSMEEEKRLYDSKRYTWSGLK